ncbi:MAG: hypothetical protein ACOYNS_10385 [Bacteroidota bacterium]
MTISELQTAIEKINNGKENEVDQDAVRKEMGALQLKRRDGTITREEEILFWMFFESYDRAEAERWTAIMRGELKAGKSDDGYID